VSEQAAWRGQAAGFGPSAGHGLGTFRRGVRFR
jgi:hypothetical protein